MRSFWSQLASWLQRAADSAARRAAESAETPRAQSLATTQVLPEAPGSARTPHDQWPAASGTPIGQAPTPPVTQPTTSPSLELTPPTKTRIDAQVASASETRPASIQPPSTPVGAGSQTPRPLPATSHPDGAGTAATTLRPVQPPAPPVKTSTQSPEINQVVGPPGSILRKLRSAPGARTPALVDSAKPVDDPKLPAPTPVAASPRPEPPGPPSARRQPRIVPVEATPEPIAAGLRLGVDFGTSTTQVAAYVEGRSPFLLRLEDLTDYMPSYYAVDQAGAPRIGAAALNLPENVHSVKPLLADDVEIEGFGHPSRLAFLMLEEVVRRAITRLRDQRLIPPSMDKLEIATNLGCTPRFGLDARVRLRDVAQRAGLEVKLASLIEEPIAAAYEIMLSGLVTDGRTLVVDMGGGTLDAAVIRISQGGQKFELFASGGSTNAGDRFTEIIAGEIRTQIRGRTTDANLSRADETLIWQRAEAAKQTLSARPSATISLGGIGDFREDTCEVTADWFRASTAGLRVLIKHDVENVYRLARLVLDRGGQLDPAPGTMDFEEPKKGIIRRLSEVGLVDDGLLHLDRVVLVGGGTNLPMVTETFKSIFGDKVLEPEFVGIDRSEIVALGLARPKPPELSDLRYPSWGVSAIFDIADVEVEEPLYEPFAPTFHIAGGYTSEYVHALSVPDGANGVAIAFRSVDGQGERWPRVDLDGHRRLELRLDLFGHIGVTADGTDLYSGVQVPWSPVESDALAEWLPPWQPRGPWWNDIPTWDPRNDK